MATDIVLTDLTNGTLSATNEWTGTGVFDKLIEAVNKNIEGQYNLGRINATDYANVYLGGLQSVIQQSMQYLLQEKQVEAQTDLLVTQKEEAVLNGTKDRLLKDKQTAEIEAKTQLTVDQDSELLLNGAKDRILKDEQLVKLKEEVDLLQTQDSEMQLDGISKRNTEAAQKLLVDRQTKGFDDDANQKLLKQVLDSWSVGFSVSQTAVAVPDTIKVDTVDSVMKQAMTNLDMTVTANPLGL